MSLKELTIDQHRNAERQKFASVLMSGSIPKQSYLRYLINQYYCYHALENHKVFKLPNELLKRCDNIQEDINELKKDLDWQLDDQSVITPSTLNYIQHVESNIDLEDQFIAHIYVRYLGDMRGGQMISKKVPGSGSYYDFDNPGQLSTSIYTLLNDGMAEEAKKVFNFATQLFIEMYDMMLEKNEL